MATRKKSITQKCFDYKTIKTFEDACKKLNLNPGNIPDLKAIPEEFWKVINAGYRLMIIFKAINDGWTPDWSNYDQYKYFPWFRVLSSGFGFSFSAYDCTDANASVGSRLCTDTKQKAMFIAKQFESEYLNFLLYSK